jgi:tetratricopeptide (TPR) repeat protein
MPTVGLYLELPIRTVEITHKAVDAFCRAVIYSPTRDVLISAMRWLQSLEEFPPKATGLSRLASLVIAAQNATDRGEYETTVGLCNRIIANDGDAVGAWRLLSSTYRRIGQHEDALVAAQRVVNLFESSSEGWYVLGLRYDQLGKTIEAASAYDQALKLDASFRVARRKLAERSMSSGDWAIAIKHLRKIVKDDPGIRANWILYGQALVGAGRYDQGSHAFDNVAKLIPDTANWKATLGYLYKSSFSLARARASFQEALKLNNESQRAISGLESCDELELSHPPIQVVSRLRTAENRVQTSRRK